MVCTVRFQICGGQGFLVSILRDGSWMYTGGEDLIKWVGVGRLLSGLSNNGSINALRVNTHSICIYILC